MGGTRAVHECLFCSQTFGSSVEKDDHVLEHFSHETCTDCNQNLIRIGGKLYTLHDAVTCVQRTDVKSESFGEASVVEQCFKSIERNVCHDVFSTECESNDQSVELQNESYEIKIQGQQQSWQLGNLTANISQYGGFADDYQIEERDDQMKIKTEEYIAKSEPEDAVMTETKPIEIEGIEPSQSQQIACSKTERKSGGVKCEICGKMLSSKSSLRTHTKAIHSEAGIMKRKIRYEKSFDKFECGICKKLLSKQSSLRVHMLATHNSDYTEIPFKRVSSVRMENNQDTQTECSRKLPNESHQVEIHEKQPGQMSNATIVRTKNTDFGSINQTESHLDIFVDEIQIKTEECIVQNDREDATMTEAHSIENENKYPSRRQPKACDEFCTRPGSVKCETCGKTLGSKRALQTHMILLHSPPGTILCKRCCKVFSKQDELDEHLTSCLIKRKATYKKYKQKRIKLECKICKKLSITKWHLRVHMRRVHHSDYDEEIKRVIDSFECYLCKSKILYKQSLERHMLAKHVSKEKPFQCELCLARFLYDMSGKHPCPAKYLSEDISGDNRMDKKQNDAIQCQICNEIFDTKQSFREHVSIHNWKGRKFKCKSCSASFWQDEKLQEHTCTKTIVCDICGKVLHKNSILNHIKIVHGSSTHAYKCDICNATFPFDSVLKQHKLIKHDPHFKKFECDVCPKSYNYISALRRHKVLSHSPDGTILCKTCAKICSTSEELIAHKPECDIKYKARLSIVTVCSICKIGIKGTHSFKRHMRVVHNKKSCDI